MLNPQKETAKPCGSFSTPHAFVFSTICLFAFRQQTETTVGALLFLSVLSPGEIVHQQPRRPLLPLQGQGLARHGLRIPVKQLEVRMSLAKRHGGWGARGGEEGGEGAHK